MHVPQCIVALAWLVVAAAAPLAARGHEIPSDVTIRTIVKPDGERLRILVRVPLEAMQDIEFPTFGPGYLDVARSGRSLEDAALLWLSNDIEVYEEGNRLPRLELVAARASIPSDRSFAGYDTALEHVLGGALPNDTQLVWQQALLDVLFEAPIESESSTFAIRPRLERLGTRVVNVVRFVPPDGAGRIFRLEGAAGLVELDPRWHVSALRFLADGFEHILDGIDHLLFLLCLILPFRRDAVGLVWIVTAFTAGHSVTLIASAFGAAPQTLWFPPLIETLIAASIFYMAIENVVAGSSAVAANASMANATVSAAAASTPAAAGTPAAGGASAVAGASAADTSADASAAGTSAATGVPGWRRGTRWALATAFGLVHGFGFSFALQETLQFAGDHVLTSLLSFNVGIELGQLLVLLLFVPVLNVVFRHVLPERLGVILLSVIVGHVAWHWMAERFAALREFDLRWADVQDAVVDSGLPWLAAALLVAAAVWLGTRRVRKRPVSTA